MAASQAEVSQKLRRTIREMVRKGKSNQEIYHYIEENYGENQIAVPQENWMQYVSMGLPYLLMGVIVVIAVGFGWFWTRSQPDDESGDGDDRLDGDRRESIDQIVSEDKNNPLH
ncbi:MAG: cytochrome c-type biogenesis protein CcmH [bacterium]